MRSTNSATTRSAFSEPISRRHCNGGTATDRGFDLARRDVAPAIGREHDPDQVLDDEDGPQREQDADEHFLANVVAVVEQREDEDDEPDAAEHDHRPVGALFEAFERGAGLLRGIGRRRHLFVARLFESLPMFEPVDLDLLEALDALERREFLR